MQIIALSVPLLSALMFLRVGDDTEHLVTAGGNPPSLVLCILDVSVVGLV